LVLVGTRFDIITYYPNLPIATNSTIFEDSKGILWTIAERGKLYRFDRSSDKFVSYDFSNRVRRIYEDKTGVLWIATDGDGFAKFLGDQNTFRVYKNNSANQNSLSDDIVNAVYEDSREFLGWNRKWSNKMDRNKETLNIGLLKASVTKYLRIETDHCGLSSNGL
jgi:ligand-binding sensor domain-containing protein